MKIRLYCVLIIGLVFFSCHQDQIPKPNHLIPRKQMVQMLADMHLAKAYEQATSYSPKKDSLKLTVDAYHSFLAKYHVSDSVFVRSLVYYSSFPKEYEKMYNEALNLLIEKQPQAPKREKLDVRGDTAKRIPGEQLDSIPELEKNFKHVEDEPAKE